MEQLNNVKVSISPGNSKMGSIPSVSLPPIVTCPEGVPCAKLCYAAKFCRMRPSVREAYQRNLDILNSDWNSYWRQVNAAIMTSRYFRFHVAGDIPSLRYFGHMVQAAVNNPHCQILAFTKRFDVVNLWIDRSGELPKNLHIVFSEWPGREMENPHNLPVAHVIFKKTEPDPDWKICGGNCTECACAGIGCWELKEGEHLAFYQH